MRFSALILATSILVTGTTFSAWAQEDDGFGAIEVTESTQPRTAPARGRQPVVGRRAAEKYMPLRKPNQQVEVVGEGAAPAASSSGGSDDHYLAIHAGGYVSDTAYKWGSSGNEKDVGNFNFGVTYRLGEWVNAADFAMRVDYSSYSVASQNASKLSFVPAILFPDASSRFPLYFGVAAGLGVFVKQLSGESAMTLDYQLLLGARFFDLYNNAGLFLEAGLKNHLHMFSDGQFNGTFVAIGSVFTF